MKYLVFWTDSREGMNEVEADNEREAREVFLAKVNMGLIDINDESTEGDLIIDYVEEEEG